MEKKIKTCVIVIYGILVCVSITSVYLYSKIKGEQNTIFEEWFNPRYTKDMNSALRAEPNWLIGGHIYSIRDLMGRKI